MRVMVIVKATEDTEAGVMPTEDGLSEMMKFNEELVDAGIMVEGDGLQPSSRGMRVSFSKGKTSVSKGPFACATELMAGYWIWQVKSMDEAVKWAKRIPYPVNEEGVVEIRPYFEIEDFGEEFTPELRDKEECLRNKMSTRC